MVFTKCLMHLVSINVNFMFLLCAIAAIRAHRIYWVLGPLAAYFTYVKLWLGKIRVVSSTT